jgi:hypothetical protein
MTTPRLIKSIGRSPLRLALLLIPLLFACFAIAQSARAVSPPPDGGYPGGNTAEGQLALGGLTTGFYNTGVGIYSLLSLTGGNNNTAVGAGALLANTADSNTAIGAGALFSHTNGIENTAIGTFALFNDIAGQSNIAIGANALLNNDVGGANTAIGGFALMNNTSGINNVALGGGSGGGVTTANNVICIGTAVAGANVDGTCFIGNISGVAVTGAPVVVDANGQLGVAPAGSPLSANELLKQQRVVQELKATTERQAAVIALQEEQVKALTAGLQKVSAQLEVSKPAPQTVLNNK